MSIMSVSKAGKTCMVSFWVKPSMDREAVRHWFKAQVVQETDSAYIVEYWTAFTGTQTKAYPKDDVMILFDD